MTQTIIIDDQTITKQDMVDMLDREIAHLNSQTWSVDMGTDAKAVIWAKVEALKTAHEKLIWQDSR